MHFNRIFNLIFIFTSLFFIWNVSRADNYCLAIRGNGELAPAHWGGIASVVEKLGFPKAQAGGSSASITMFLIDAMASNPYVKNDKIKAALLIKSMHGVLNELAETPQWQQIASLYSKVQETQKNGVQPQILELLALLNSSEFSDSEAKSQLLKKEKEISNNLKSILALGLIDPVSFGPLLQSVEALPGAGSPQEVTLLMQRIRFYAQELKTTVSVFGQFDAASDSNLFFRPGIVNFEALAHQFGRVAQFYSGENINIKTQWEEFLIECSEVSKNKTWNGLSQVSSNCVSSFKSLFKAHFDNEPQQNFEDKKIGSAIASYPITSVLSQESYKNNKVSPTAYEQADVALNDYPSSLSSQFGQKFIVSNPDTVRIGYWGDDQHLEKIKKNLPQDDEKSLRFMGLGSAPWKLALSLSPAEPGLSPIKRFESKGRQLISAGGWPDLSPVVVLKASGCGKVVYVTRRGGEAMFAQGVAKKLLGEDQNWKKDWEDLKTQPQEIGKVNSIKNDHGDKADMTSLWSRLYNMANPQSSIQRALKNVDAVLCTDWNSFDVKTQLAELIEQAYSSPFYVAPRAERERVFGSLQPRLETKALNENGYPEFTGCFPRQD